MIGACVGFPDEFRAADLQLVAGFRLEASFVFDLLFRERIRAGIPIWNRNRGQHQPFLNEAVAIEPVGIGWRCECSAKENHRQSQ